MKSAATFFLLLLCGCSTDIVLENRLACSLARDKLFYVSEYGKIGVSTEVAEADKNVVCASSSNSSAPAGK